MLSFSLLAQVTLYKDGTPLSRFRSQKELALLIYLAHTGQTFQREFIADFLWDGRSTAQTLSNLRTVLARLRKQVGETLLITRKSLALAPESRSQVDSAVLLQTLDSIKQIDSAEDAAALQQALDTYQGDFLAGFHLPDAQQFNEWMVVTREHIHRQVTCAYDKLGQYALSIKDAEYGIAIAHAWLQVDRLDEAAYMLLIQMLIESSKVREAVAQYEQYADLLHAELGITPPAEMKALLRDVWPQRSMPAHPTPAHQSPAHWSPAHRAPQNQTATAVAHNIPPAYDQFFGREIVQQEIHNRLDQPWCRLVTITGLGGVGKTRLATTIARHRISQYADGVWLVELADIDADDDSLAEAIVVEIATAVDLRLSGAQTPAEQLLTHLQHKQMLLVLDNFEHLLGGMQIVLDLLQRCEHVQMIVTSREPLQIRAEWTIALNGLDCPTGETEKMASDALGMFAARHAQRQWGTISTDDQAAIHTICRAVEGLPLAIELAAALTASTTPRAIADSLRDGYDALKTSLRDVPQRHRGLHIVFDMSWRMLAQELQQQLARLSRFRGGFTETAAFQIAEADAQHLDALCRKSLLTHNAATDRYTFHPVIRAYAAEKRLHADPTPQKHADYFLTLLAQHSEALQKDAPQHSVAVIQPDMENVHLAWQTGLDQRYAGLLSAALTSLSIYYQLRGLAYEAEAVMQTTGQAAAAWGADGMALATRAGLERARFQNRLGRYRPAIQTIHTALKWAAQCDDRWAVGMGHVLWGEALWRLGEYDASEEKLTHTLTIAQALDDTQLIGWCHHHLGVINDIQSRHATANDHLQQACTAWQTNGNAQALSNSLNSIGLICYHQGDLPAAQQAMEQALAICEQIDDRHRQSTLISNLSMISTEQGDYAGAHYYLQLGLNLATINGDLYVQGAIHNNLSKNYYRLGDLDAAETTLEQGMQILESIGDPTLRATAIFNLAEIRKGQGDPERAESLYRQALAIARRDNLQFTECEVLIGMAELVSKKNESEAGQYSAQAIALAESLQNPRLLERATGINHYLSVDR